MKKKRPPKYYPATRSPLFRIGTKRRLRKVLNISDNLSFDKLLSDEMFRTWSSDTAKGKPRNFATPQHELKRIHKDIFKLLQKIETPTYIHSGKKGLSAITNAKHHIGEQHLVKLDIKNFYPSSSRQYVYSFFKEQMQCVSDVADVLSKIVTHSGSVPTGSSVSQLIIYFAYKPMFDEIEGYAKSLGGKMTCYVDDITISGALLSPTQLNELNQIVRKYGLAAHKFKRYKPVRAKLVTGVILKGEKMIVRNRTHKEIFELRNELEKTVDQPTREKIMSKLRGHLNYAGQIEPKFKNYASRLSAKKN